MLKGKLSAIKTVAELIQIALKMLFAKTMICSGNKGFGICNDRMQPFQVFGVRNRVANFPLMYEPFYR